MLPAALPLPHRTESPMGLALFLYICFKTQPHAYSHILEQLKNDTDYYPLTQEEEESKEKKKLYSY